MKEKGGLSMTKLLAKLAEKYAKSTNTACFVWLAWHQPKMPASLVVYKSKLVFFFKYFLTSHKPKPWF